MDLSDLILVAKANPNNSNNTGVDLTLITKWTLLVCCIGLFKQISFSYSTQLRLACLVFAMVGQTELFDSSVPSAKWAPPVENIY